MPLSLDETLTQELQALEAKHLRRRPVITEALEGVEIRRDGKRYVNFSGNDYFGLSRHPKVIAAAARTLEAYGTGAGASPLVTGYHPGYASLCEALAEYKGTQACALFGSGYLANLGTITALMDKGDLILADRLAHACIIDGAQLSGAALKRFRHNDLAHLEQLLHKRGEYRHCLIISETVFSMDGDCAPLTELATIARAHDAWLMSDDAHGIGFISNNPAQIQLGTLSKGLGSMGGYVCGSQALVDMLYTKARPMIFATALPPSATAAAEAALDVLSREPERAEHAIRHARYFCEAMGLPAPQSPIVPLIVGESAPALHLSEQLKERGMLAVAIRPPTVPKGSARLRFSFSAAHSDQQVEQLVQTLKTVMKAS